MNILAISKVYPPKINNGSISLHYVLKFLQSQGHDIKVINPAIEIHESYQHEGIKVLGKQSSNGLYLWCDLIITQLYAANEAIGIGMRYNKPVFHLLHSSENESYTSVLKGLVPNNYVIYNSENVARGLGYNLPSIILNPPIEADKYSISENPIFNQYVTLINLNYNKGVSIFYDIVASMPGHRFLGVKGSEQNQIVKSFPNLTVVENTPHPKWIYERTRILLMPSLYESWGRTANEAMLNGIPVICSHAEGLQENLSYAGIFVDREDIQGWINAIETLDADPFYYDQIGNLCKQRFNELDFNGQLHEVERFITMR